ncbi:MAG: nicotinate phosphoribosyltransferase [Candidatus Promineifilaceae bacterium]
MNQQQQSLAEGILYTDQYQLTMAQLYFHAGLHEQRVRFDHFYRSNPNYGSHQAGYCINAGLEWLLNWMETAHFNEHDLSQMRGMMGANGTPLFDAAFLDWLRDNGNFGALTIRAIPEGRVVHPNVPLTVVEGPLLMAQILETSLLNHLNYQTLIATKAARIRQAGRNRPMLEFGMRRGHERGVNAGTRAALIGGADFSSNAGVSHALGIPPKGTHAHAMVQLFMALAGDESGELEAFQAYADLYPDDCLLLVDTINTLRSGVPNAIRVFEKLRAKGHRPVGIRLDSGDLAYLAVQSAKLLDQAGFEDVNIVLSDSLDEMSITQIVRQIGDEAVHYQMDADQILNRLVYGVGTRLITSRGASSLGGVYKLVAAQNANEWKPAIKLSENPHKVPNPGNKRAWRIYDQRGLATADLLTLSHENPADWDTIPLRHPTQPEMQRSLSRQQISKIEPLHVTILDNGKRTYGTPSIGDIRAQRDADLGYLDPGVRRLLNPHIYHVSLSQALWEMKQALITKMRT